MSKPKLSEIEGRAEGATEGPWDFDPHSHIEKGCRCMSCYGAVTAWQISTMRSCDETPTTEIDNLRCESDGFTFTDATFIAAARTDVPALTAAIRAVLAVVSNSQNPIEGGYIFADDVRRTLADHLDLA